MSSDILLIRTGGTIDAVPYEDPRNPPETVATLKGDQSLIAPALRLLGIDEAIDMHSWSSNLEDTFVKDSQEFTAHDIALLADIISRDEHKYIVITHGTDAMTVNAKRLQEALGSIDKTIIFTGAMVPLSMHQAHGSDGLEALAFACGKVQDPPSGVYVAAHDKDTRALTLFDAAIPHTKIKDASKANLEYIIEPVAHNASQLF